MGALLRGESNSILAIGKTFVRGLEEGGLEN